MPTKLKNLVITKVALVNEGSCSAAHIKLYKRREGGTSTMTFDEIIKSLPDDQQLIVQDEITKAKAELPAGAVSPEDAATLAAAASKAELEKVAALDEVANLQKAKTEPSEEEILKGLDPAIVAILEKSKLQAATAQAVVKQLKDEADEREALTKAKELTHIGIETEKLAKTLKELANTNSALGDDVFAVLKAADALISDGAMKEIGTSNVNTEALAKAADTAWNAIEKQADEIKKAKACSKEQAVTQAIKENPDLYTQYLANLE